jgi:uncharacterized membrane protein YtjA (UPF0391 family)
MNILKWIADRAKEPSTIGIVAAVLGFAGISVDEGMLGEILLGVGALLAVIAAARKEKGAE